MKTKRLTSVLFVLAGVAMVAFSGCQSSVFHHQSNTAPSAPPAMVQQAAPNAQASVLAASNPQPQVVSVDVQRPEISQATMDASFAQQRRVPYSSNRNMIDVWKPRKMSGAAFTVMNPGPWQVSIEIGDQTVGVPNGAGGLMRIVLPPGESYEIPDYIERPEGTEMHTQIKAIILDDHDGHVGYYWATASWPARGWFFGDKMLWNIGYDECGKEVPPAMFKKPVQQAPTGITTVSSHGAVGQMPKLPPPIIADPVIAGTPPCPPDATVAANADAAARWKKLEAAVAKDPALRAALEAAAKSP